DPVADGGAPGWLRRVREELDDRPTETVRVRDVAVDAGVHPVSLARAFRRHFGVSITTYRKRQRLQRAAHAAAGSAAPLGRIAHASGYADQAHFCREFRRAAGITPSGFRRLVGGS
ncbi:MAG: AraC family transcriptional regulator, partial [Gemmatimonadota bacterium]